MPLPEVTPAILVNFVIFRGSEERSPCFQWVECKFVIFAVFIKTALFGRGQEHGLKTQFVPPRVKIRNGHKKNKLLQNTAIFRHFLLSARKLSWSQAVAANLKNTVWNHLVLQISLQMSGWPMNLNRQPEESEPIFLDGKVQMRAEGLRPFSAIRAQSSAIVHICGLSGPSIKGISVAKQRQFRKRPEPAKKTTTSKKGRNGGHAWTEKSAV